MQLDCGGRALDLRHPGVMGIVNITADSFSGDGVAGDVERACAQAFAMERAGAVVIDVGGESTRPGADAVSEQDEIARVVPVIQRLAPHLRVPISVDTRKPAVMRAAVAAGAGLINDISALRAPGALDAARELGVPVILMHMRGEPATMQDAPHYTDVLREVRDFLAGRIAACVAAGLSPTRLLVDPGFGFGKTVAHNLMLLRQLHQLRDLGLPVVAGLSRKSMIGVVSGAPPGERLPGSLALATLAAWQGAMLLRSHDVAATVQALAMVGAVREAQ